MKKSSLLRIGVGALALAVSLPAFADFTGRVVGVADGDSITPATALRNSIRRSWPHSCNSSTAQRMKRSPSSAGQMRLAGCSAASSSTSIKRRFEYMTSFARYVGIDYSGAETPSSSLKGLRVYLAEGASAPRANMK